MAEEKKQSTNVSAKELTDAIALIKKSNMVSEKILFRYMKMLDFIESEGLTEEWRAYYSQFLGSQSTAEN